MIWPGGFTCQGTNSLVVVGMQFCLEGQHFMLLPFNESGDVQIQTQLRNFSGACLAQVYCWNGRFAADAHFNVIRAVNKATANSWWLPVQRNQGAFCG
jgi:hypothetical protein